MTKSDKLLSRACDLTVAAAALLFLAPLLLIVALAVWLEDRGPSLVTDERIGRSGRVYRWLRFRTLGRASGAVSRPERCTRVGAFLLRARLDETPQLWNVVLGQMSLVGPRPMRPEEIVSYGEAAKDYCTAGPGVVAPSATARWGEERVRDIEYVRDPSFSRYLHVLWTAVPFMLTTGDV